MDIADEIRRYRLEHDLTWRQLAARVGMSTNGICKIAQRGTVPYERTAHRIRTRLGLTSPAVTERKETHGEVVSHGC